MKLTVTYFHAHTEEDTQTLPGVSNDKQWNKTRAYVLRQMAGDQETDHAFMQQGSRMERVENPDYGYPRS